MNDTPQETDPTQPDPSAAAEKKGGGLGWLLLFIVAALVVVGTKLYWPQMQTALRPVMHTVDAVRGLSRPESPPPVQPAAAPGSAAPAAQPTERPAVTPGSTEPTSPPPAATAENRTPKVSAMAPPADSPPDFGPDFGPDSGADATLNSGPDAKLESLRAAVARLGARLDHLETALQPAAHAAAVTLALIEFDRHVASGEPFRRSLDAVAALGGGDAALQGALDGLEPLADGGVATLSELRRSFAAAAKAVMQANTRGESTGLMGEVRNALGGLVSVRRTDPQTGTPVEAALARAENALGEGDLKTAAVEMGTLSGAEARAAARWLDRAQSRLEAERQLDALLQHARQLLARQTDGG